MQFTNKKELWQKLKNRCIKNKETTCLEWQGAINGRGYPNIQININGYVNKWWSGNRLTYFCKVGDIPPGMFVCHKCDNPKCMKPSHLFLGSHQENMDDMVEKGRSNTDTTHLYKYIKGNTFWKGRKHTEETKEKMRLSAQGKHVGKKNSQFGTCWIYNLKLKKSKKIAKFEFLIWKKEGWLLGRKIKW